MIKRLAKHSFQTSKHRHISWSTKPLACVVTKMDVVFLKHVAAWIFYSLLWRSVKKSTPLPYDCFGSLVFGIATLSKRFSSPFIAPSCYLYGGHVAVFIGRFHTHGGATICWREDLHSTMLKALPLLDVPYVCHHYRWRVFWLKNWREVLANFNECHLGTRLVHILHFQYLVFVRMTTEPQRWHRKIVF